MNPGQVCRHRPSGRVVLATGDTLDNGMVEVRWVERVHRSGYYLPSDLAPVGPGDARAVEVRAPLRAPAAMLALLLLASAAPAQDAPPLILIGSDAVTKAPLRWTLVEPAGTPFEVYGPVVIVRSPAPGTTYRFAVEVAAPAPPAPAPAPAPVRPIPYVPPAPAAYAGHLQAILIFEIDEPSTAGLRVSKIKDALKALDCDWKVRDSTTADAQAFLVRLRADGLVDAAGTVTTPVVYLLGDDSVIHGTVKAPTRPEDVTNAVKAVRGAK